jgi:hypothetical protein
MIIGILSVFYRDKSNKANPSRVILIDKSLLKCARPLPWQPDQETSKNDLRQPKARGKRKLSSCLV